MNNEDNFFKAIGKLFIDYPAKSVSTTLVSIVFLVGIGWQAAKIMTLPCGDREKKAIEFAYQNLEIELPSENDNLRLIQTLTKKIKEKLDKCNNTPPGPANEFSCDIYNPNPTNEVVWPKPKLLIDGRVTNNIKKKLWILVKPLDNLNLGCSFKVNCSENGLWNYNVNLPDPLVNKNERSYEIFVFPSTEINDDYFKDIQQTAQQSLFNMPDGEPNNYCKSIKIRRKIK